jgi:hypothetical protein
MTNQRTSPNDDLQEQIAAALHEAATGAPADPGHVGRACFVCRHYGDAVMAVVEPALAERDDRWQSGPSRAELVAGVETLARECDAARRVIAAVEAVCEEYQTRRIRTSFSDRLFRDLRAALAPTDSTEVTP